MKIQKEKSHYVLDSDTKKIILGLIEKCIELELGNVSFDYYPTFKNPHGVNFHLSEYKDGWELVIQQKERQKVFRDIYNVDNNDLKYQYTESDTLRE